MSGFVQGFLRSQGGCTSRENVVHQPNRCFRLQGRLWGGGCVKGAFQVVHSHGSIEVVLTKPRPSPLEQHCAGLPKACGNQLWERITSLLFPARNGHQQSSLGEGVMVGKQLNHCASSSALRLLFDLQDELSELTLIGAECFPWERLIPAGIGLAEAISLDAKATGLKLGTGLGGRVAFEARSTDRTGRLNQECLSSLEQCIKHSAPSQCTLIPCNWQSALRTVLMWSISVPQLPQGQVFGMARNMATKVRWASSLSVRV